MEIEDIKKLIAKGEKIEYNIVLEKLIKRDYQDSHREINPLKQAEDAVFMDTSDMSIEENIDAALEFGAVDTVCAAVDTIVSSEDGKVISEIPDRSKMYQGQTPQSFRISVLKDLYNSLSDDEKKTLTDACKICVVRNFPVHLVEGSITNLKITTTGDYKIAQAMLGCLKAED